LPFEGFIIKILSINITIVECKGKNFILDRDINAAINIKVAGIAQRGDGR
jgi:transposase